jgi:hypothetical protein
MAVNTRMSNFEIEYEHCKKAHNAIERAIDCNFLKRL